MIGHGALEQMMAWGWGNREWCIRTYDGVRVGDRTWCIRTDGGMGVG